jgi:hypothetical protein
MIQVGLLTIEQKDSLVGQFWETEVYFNPVQDLNNNWVLSTEEMQGNTNPNFTWVSELPLIPFEKKPVEPNPVSNE